MDYTLQNAYNSIVSANLLYQNNRDRWQFLLESYLGGDEYRRGGHLTKYSMETSTEYQARLNATPLDNHCRSIISTYTSFLFRECAERDFGSLSNNLNLTAFLEDADLDGRSLEAFMKDVAIWASVFGHVWVMVAKPQSNVATRADELEQGIRPYVNLITPLTVTDWRWARSASGAYTLTYLKYIEEVNDTLSTIKEWTETEIRTSVVNHTSREVDSLIIETNGLGRIPAVIAYASRSPVRGIGASLITDIADMQRKIYNEYSEVESSIRLNGHPTLVKTADVECSTGAGSIAIMPDGMDPGLVPYMLTVSTDIDSIYNSIDKSIEAIDKMANTGAVRQVAATTISGVAMITEFQLLNAKLAEIADGLELAEEQIWRLWALYEGTAWDGEVDYPGSFNIQDPVSEIDKLLTAKSAATDPRVLAYIDHELLEQLGGESDMIIPEIYNPQDIPAVKPFEPHYMIDLSTGIKYIARTIEEHMMYSELGYVHEEDLPKGDY